jgi:hypothetical protein
METSPVGTAQILKIDLCFKMVTSGAEPRTVMIPVIPMPETPEPKVKETPRAYLVAGPHIASEFIYVDRTPPSRRFL